jgi:hypothetical protein
MAPSKSNTSKLEFGEGTFAEVEAVWDNETLEQLAAMDQIEYMADRRAEREAQLIKFDAWRAHKS